MRPPLEHDDLARLVQAAQDGDRDGVEALVGAYLPLVYNIVGRALQGHADTDDVVQETMLRALERLPQLRDPERFRAWLVSIAIRLVRDRQRATAARNRRELPVGEEAYQAADPGADFADLTVLRLGLSGQRRETVEASRWLDAEDGQVLALWWMELAGELERAELVAALGVESAHAAVRIQRLKARLETSRLVVRALAARPGCPQLEPVVAAWDGRPGPVWRKRLARHVRECEICAQVERDLVPAEKLLAVIGLVTPALGVGAYLVKTSTSGSWGVVHLAAVTAAAALTVVAVVGGPLVLTRPDQHPRPRAPAPTATTASPIETPAGPAPTHGPAKDSRASRIPEPPKIVAVSTEPDLAQNARVTARDAARSVGSDGKIYWIFNDTTLNGPWAFMANSISRGSVPGQPLSAAGIPRPWLDVDASEASTQTANRKIAFWATGTVADPARHRILISYEKVCRGTDPAAPCGAEGGSPIGSGFGALDPRDGTLTRLDAAGSVRSPEGTDPRLTFSPDESYPVDVIDRANPGTVYGYRCAPWPADGSPVPDDPSQIGRVPLASVQRPGAWSYLDGRTWTRRADDASPAGPVCGSGHTVQWVPGLGLYLNTYLPTLGGDVQYQVAAAPAGPWSRPRRLASVPAPADDNSRPAYSLAAHPAYSEDDGLTQFLTYNDPASGRQRVLRVRLDKP